MSFRVRLTPRASASEIRGVNADGELAVRVHAPPVDGAANEALVRLLADELDVPRSAITITRGATGRHKTVRVDGVADVELHTHWPGLQTTDR